MSTGLFDVSGEPVAFIDDDGETIYSYQGKPLAWISEDAIYNYKGKYLGWIENGWIYDLTGRPSLFHNEVTGGPRLPIRKIEPIKGIKQILPIRPIKQIQTIRPIKTVGWSELSGIQFFSQ